MYDEPPDPEPNPCPMCEAELGYGEGCAMCKMASELDDANSKLADLKMRLATRVRLLADTPIYAEGERANGIEPRFMMALSLLMDLGGLSMPDELLKQARASVLPEYGEYGGDAKHDPERIDRWAAMQWQAQSENLGRYLPSDLLDRRGASHRDTLWILHLTDGQHVVATEAEKRQRNDWSGGSGGPWTCTLREFIDDALQKRERSVGFWVEFALEYAAPPKGELKHGERISYVVGDEAYTAYVGYHRASPYGGTGFGGAPFLVRLADGRSFFTTNNWSRGTVPEHMRKQLRSNAVFAPGEEAEAERRKVITEEAAQA